jgi:hypothetical protein
MRTVYYEYDQNNSGGSFIQDDKVTHRVFVECDNSVDAKWWASKLGIYFDGVADGIDCPCCGDRRYEANRVEFPYSYGSFDESEAKRIADKYGCDIAESKKQISYHKDPHDVVFKNIESYAQYLADRFSWTEPDAYIYKKDKTKAEIFKEK